MKNRLYPTQIFISCFLASLLATAFVSGQNKTPKLGQSTLAEVVQAMTLEEKVKLLVGAGFKFPGVNTGSVLGQTQDRVPGAAGTTQAIARLSIPSLVTSDGPAGVRIDSVRKGQNGKTFYATAWPVATLLASSWDTALVRQVGIAFGHEIKEYGIDIILGPGMNIHRNPLGGRNFEYYSEDPLVTGRIAAAMVSGIQSVGVGTSIKHFAANNQESNRMSVNAVMTERALREIYLKGFEIAVKEAKPWTVMSSYNLINGRYTSENPDLLTTILRNEWGFKGFVMTDWFGGRDAVAQIIAGNNLLMPGTPAQGKALLEAAQSGKISEKVLNKNVSEILAIILRSPSFQGYAYSDHPPLKSDAELSRSAASEGMILLKNEDHTLPLTHANLQISIFGNNGYDLIAGGTGSGDVNKAYKVSLDEGLTGAGYLVNKDLQDRYHQYLHEYSVKFPKKSMMQEFMSPTQPAAEYALDKDLITKKADSTDLALIVLGRNAGEGRDRKIENDYDLSPAQLESIERVVEAFHAKHKKVVVVLNIGGVINVMPWRDQVDAILLAWQPGMEGGHAIADVLSGKVNPSGKLATSFPLKYDDVSSAKNFPGREFPEKATTGMFGMKLIPAEVSYQEGIYVGYRYYNTFHKQLAYDFGYGLSYTHFTYSNLSLSSQNFNKSLTASIQVTNSGKVPGKEVVQLYLSAPADKLDKPSEELKGFAKTALLQPGESETIHFTLTPTELASFNMTASSWIADAGRYQVKIGASSMDIKLTQDFNLSKSIVVEKVKSVLKPLSPINELKNR